VPEHHEVRIDDEIRVQDEVTASPVLLDLSPVTIRAGGKLELTVPPPPATATAEGPTPSVVVDEKPQLVLTEQAWHISTIGYGFLVGTVLGNLVGAPHTGEAIGAIAGYFWGSRRWRDARRGN
jgi:hypothetical protein